MKILKSILTLGCLGGMVSCYPVANQNTQNTNQQRTATSSTPKEKIKKKATTAPKKKVVKNTTSSTSSTPDYSSPYTSSNDSGSTVENKPVMKKPAVPAVAKTASKVPGKDGFVFNPYTHNQVDVRGIPSGTKVRDPHDSNSAHVFRVP